MTTNHEWTNDGNELRITATNDVQRQLMTHDDTEKRGVCESSEINTMITNDMWRQQMTQDDNEWRKMTTNDVWHRMTLDENDNEWNEWMSRTNVENELRQAMNDKDDNERMTTTSDNTRNNKK